MTNINETLDRLHDLSIHTDQGTLVRLEDVRRLMIEKELEGEELPDIPPLKTWSEAKQAAAEYLRSEWGPSPVQVGRSIPASPSATEGVNS